MGASGPVRVPALALYAEESAADIAWWLDAAATSLATQTFRDVWFPWMMAERARLKEELPGVRIVVFRSHHYQFLSHPEETEKLMRSFSGTLR